MAEQDFGDYNPYVGYYIHRTPTPTWGIIPSVTDYIDLTYVVSGSAVYSVDQAECQVTAGDLLCVPKGVLRSAVAVPDNLIECYSLNLNLYNHRGEECSLPFPLVSPIGYQPDVIKLFEGLNEEWLHRSYGYQMKVRAHVLLILERYFERIVARRDFTQMDSRIKKCVQYITNHFMEAITINDLAALTGLNPVYLGKLFQRATRMTFRQCLTYIRLNHAENILKSGEYNVSETAAMCGFSDVFYFSKAFKENRGVSPSSLLKGSRATDALPL